jgi:predicted lipoprotein with Yx(FWY)xxD motif
MTAMMRTALAAALTLGASAALAEMPAMPGDTAMGKVLVDMHGMTLYTYDKDEGGISACYDKCATNWPPLLAAEGAMAEGDYALTKRTDGAMQWTYDGKPLYLWVKDAQPGDTTGDGVGGVWHVVKEE